MRRARLEFGGSSERKKECREGARRKFSLIAGAGCPTALRTLGKNPGFNGYWLRSHSALGIGASTSRFQP